MILRFKGQYDNLDKSYKFRDHIKNNVFLTTHVINVKIKYSSKINDGIRGS